MNQFPIPSSEVSIDFSTELNRGESLSKDELGCVFTGSFNRERHCGAVLLRPILSVWRLRDSTFPDQRFGVGCKAVSPVIIPSLTHPDREEKISYSKKN